MLTETWLKDEVPNGEISLPGMLIKRRDRLTKGGGVIIYYRQDLICTDVNDRRLNLKDTLWCHLQLRSGDTAILDVVYHPPQCSDHDEAQLIDNIKCALGLRCSHVWLTGDFNLF